MKTVLGDNLKDFLKIGNTICPNGFNENHQLLRCKKQKTIESEYLLKMPKNSSFLDIGSNFGDTVLTMALHAKKNNRYDIRFFCFEPNKIKCLFIEKVAEINELKIKVYNYCVGYSKGYVISDGIKNTFKGSCSYKYNNISDGIEVIKIDDINNIIEPVGLMHVDTEGWEIEVLKGSNKILNNEKNSLILICECWSDKIAKSEKNRGRSYNIMSATPRKDILNLISKYNFKQLEDIIDSEDENIAFRIN